MPTYDVILPEGHVILRDRATGAELRLSAANGPLCLGSANFSFSLDLKPLMGKSVGSRRRRRRTLASCRRACTMK